LLRSHRSRPPPRGDRTLAHLADRAFAVGLRDGGDRLLDLEVLDVGRSDLQAPDRDDNDDDDATTIPIKVMPRWFLMDSPSLKCSEAPRLAEIEPDEKRLSDDILVRNETPYAAVRRVVACRPS